MLDYSTIDHFIEDFNNNTAVYIYAIVLLVILIERLLNWLSGKSYSLYVTSALLVTPISVYVFQSIYWFFRYDYGEIPTFLEVLMYLAGFCLTLGPICAFVLLVKSGKDEEKGTFQKIIYALILPLSLFVSFFTLVITIVSRKT